MMPASEGWTMLANTPQPQMRISDVLTNISEEVSALENRLRATLNRINPQPESPVVGGDKTVSLDSMMNHTCIIRDAAMRCSHLLSELEASL